MFDPNRFVADCQAALHSTDPAAAIAALLADALRDPRELAGTFVDGAGRRVWCCCFAPGP
jgi:hypothetical protein